MNNIAVVPYIGLHALQIQNVKRNVVKKASIQELNNEINTNVNVKIERKDEVVESNIPANNSSITDLPEAASNEKNIGSNLD